MWSYLLVYEAGSNSPLPPLQLSQLKHNRFVHINCWQQNKNSARGLLVRTSPEARNIVLRTPDLNNSTCHVNVFDMSHAAATVLCIMLLPFQN
jgi:hypothetical protein